MFAQSNRGDLDFTPAAATAAMLSNMITYTTGPQNPSSFRYLRKHGRRAGNLNLITVSPVPDMFAERISTVKCQSACSKSLFITWTNFPLSCRPIFLLGQRVVCTSTLRALPQLLTKSTATCTDTWLL